MAHLRGLLSPAECAHIIRLGVQGGELHRSRVVRHVSAATAEAATVGAATAEAASAGASTAAGGVAACGALRVGAVLGAGADQAGGEDEMGLSAAQEAVDAGDDAYNAYALRVDGRTSESCCLSSRNECVRRAVERAAWLVGLTPDHAEAAQLVHYLPGQEYKPHYDWYSPKARTYRAGTAVQGNRLVSVFVYLSRCEGGGRTTFPLLELSFAPEPGCAVLWYNLDRRGRRDDLTLHAGEPVTAGEKWGLNIFLRERPRMRAGSFRGLLPRARLELRPVRLEDSSCGVRVQICPREAHVGASFTSPGVRPCARCGDPVGPIGLCLCELQYPSNVPPIIS